MEDTEEAMTLTTETLHMEPSDAVAAARAFCDQLRQILEREITAGKLPTWSMSRPVVRDVEAERAGRHGCMCWKTEPVITVLIDLDPNPLMPVDGTPAGREADLQDQERRLVEQLRRTSAAADQYARDVIAWIGLAQPFVGGGLDEMVKPVRGLRDAAETAAVEMLRAMDARGRLADVADDTLRQRVEMAIKAREAGKAARQATADSGAGN